MEDDAPVTCPVCGADLPPAEQPEKIHCFTCGFDFQAREIGGKLFLDPIITCPVCGCHDRTVSVTDLLRYYSAAAREDQPGQPGLDRLDPHTIFILEQIKGAAVPPAELPELLKRLEPPPAPRYKPGLDFKNNSPKSALSLLVMPALLGFPLACLLFTAGLPNANSTSLDFGIFFVCLFLGVGAVFFLIDAALDLRRSEEVKARAGMTDRENWRDFYKKNEQWKKAVQRWNGLYYCGRDECIFLPNTNTAASVAKMDEYLFQP